MDFQIKLATKEWRSDVKCEEAQWFSLTVSVPPLMTVYGRLRVWMTPNDFLGKGFLREPLPPTGTGALSKQGYASASHLPTHPPTYMHELYVHIYNIWCRALSYIYISCKEIWISSYLRSTQMQTCWSSALAFPVCRPLCMHCFLSSTP